MIFDASSEEVRFTEPLVERLSGRFAFHGRAQTEAQGPWLVDVVETNRATVLHGLDLSTFRVPTAEHSMIIRMTEAASRPIGLSGHDLAICLLCGGLSFRSGGRIHPLLPVSDPRGGTPRTLLHRQLARIDASPVARAWRCLAATPFNEGTLREHVAALEGAAPIEVFAGGMAPRLSSLQYASGPVLRWQAPDSEPSYNPAGHFEALRWFVVKGLLAKCLDREVLVIASYSNWGDLYTTDLLAIAGHAAKLGRADPDNIFFAEAVNCPPEEEHGSVVVERTGDLSTLRLVKKRWAPGAPCSAGSSPLLLSTNTLYFVIPNLVRRLVAAGPVVGLSLDVFGVEALLRSAANGEQRERLVALFDAAFPVEPQLIPAMEGDAVRFLRVERDLDQISLLPGRVLGGAIVVPDSRYIAIKYPQDLADPVKQAFLFPQ